MNFEPKFVTVDDFKNYWGKDLRSMLKDEDNPSNGPSAFLARTESEMKRYIDHNTFRRFRYEDLRGEQLDAFREAILLQAMYKIRNGEIGMDSGYDIEHGIVAKRSELVEITLCQDAINVLSNAGLWNLVMKNRPRKFGGGFIPGDFS